MGRREYRARLLLLSRKLSSVIYDYYRAAITVSVAEAIVGWTVVCLP